MPPKAKAKPAPKPKAKPAAATVATITGEELEALTGITDRRIRQIAKEGYFTPPVRGTYQRDITIQGLFKYYREGKENNTQSMHEAKLKKLSAEADMAEIKLQETKHEVIPFKTAQATLDRMLAKWHQLLTQKLEIETPARLNGKPIAAARQEAKIIHDEISTTINENFNDTTSELKE